MQKLRLEKETWNKKLKDWNIISEHIFEDINDLVQYLKTVKTNDKVFDHESSETLGLDDGWHDFESYPKALEGLELGTDKYFNEFKQNIKKVKDYLSSQEIQKLAGYKNDVVGFSPIVPNTIIGNPINMINSNKKEKPIPTAKIMIEKANSSGVNSADMISFYAIITALIDILEQKGIRCEIWMSDSFLESPEVYVYKLKLKDFNQPINMYKIQFPIIATDMFRRIGFKLLETNQELKDRDWNWGYGSPLIGRAEGFSLKSNGEIEEGIKNLLQVDDNDIFIPNCAYFDYHKDDDIGQAIREIIKGTNFNKYINLKED